MKNISLVSLNIENNEIGFKGAKKIVELLSVSFRFYIYRIIKSLKI
jgi:hypothetical protein